MIKVLASELISLMSFLSIVVALGVLFFMECALWVVENGIAYLIHLQNKNS